eukprot:9255909-Pyramimonas_sp.AAC.1
MNVATGAFGGALYRPRSAVLGGADVHERRRYGHHPPAHRARGRRVGPLVRSEDCTQQSW